MKNKSFTATFLVDQSPEEVFNAINNVRGWWSKGLTGNSQKMDDEFIYQHKHLHYSKQRVIDMVPNRRVTWLVTESTINFVKNKSEWNNTKITFEISKKGSKTQLRFTHLGLVPDVECYTDCTGGWSYYLTNSLLPLITTGKGQPDEKEISSVPQLKHN